MNRLKIGHGGDHGRVYRLIISFAYPLKITEEEI